MDSLEQEEEVEEQTSCSKSHKAETELSQRN